MPPAQGPPQSAIQVSAEAAIIIRFHWGKSWFQVHYHGCWQSSGTHRLSARDISFLPHGPLHRTAHNTAGGLHQSQRGREHNGVPEMEGTIFCHLTLEMTSHHLCHILFIRSRTLSLAPIQEEGITEGHKQQKGEITGGRLRACQPRRAGLFRSVY